MTTDQHGIGVRIGRRLARWIDLILAVALTGLAYWQSDSFREGVPQIEAASRTGIYGTTASIYGALLGFVIAGMTILMTMQHNERLDLLAEAGQVKKILRMFGRAAKWLFVGTLSSLAMLMVDRGPEPVVWCAIAYVFVGIGIIYRVTASLFVLDQVADIASRN